MKNIFVVESPFQLLCAYEAIEYFKTNDNILIIRYASNTVNNTQLKKIIDSSLFSKIYELDIVSISNVLYYSPLLLKILYLKKNNNIFLGDYRGKLMHIIYRLVSRKKIVILDDGLYTLDLYEKMKNNKVQKINLFTIFDLKPLSDKHNIYKNKFTKFKNNITTININKENIFFLGAGTVEAGYIQEELYVEYIKKIKKYYEAQNLNFIYIPHRRENLIKFNKINMLNIKRFEYPSEIQFMFDKITPYRIASFYSTTLITLKYLYDVVYVDSFPYRYDDLLETVRESYRSSETLLKKYKFIEIHNNLKMNYA